MKDASPARVYALHVAVIALLFVLNFVYLFLYTPIALVVLFSFNAGRNASEFTGFSTHSPH